MPHLEDEYVYYFQAKVFGEGHATNPAAPVLEAFFMPNVILKDGWQFGKSFPGFPLLLAIGIKLGQPWIINSLAAALGILATFLLGRDFFDRNTGLLAAALGAISPMYVILSGTMLPHTTCLASLTFFAWAFLRARQTTEIHRHNFAWVAGALGGIALIIRPWTTFGIGLPFAILAIHDWIRKHDATHDICWRMLLTFISVGSILPLYNFLTTGSPFTNLYTMWWSYDTIGFGSQFGGGHDWDKAMFDLSVDLDMFGTVLTGWPIVLDVPLVWLVVGVGIFLSPRAKIEIALLIPPITLIVAYLAYWSSSAGIFGPRYYAETMPFLWLLIARGLIKASAFSIGNRIIQISLPLCIAWGIIFVTLPRLSESRELNGISRQDMNRIATFSLHHALVFVQSDYWTDYASLSWLNAADLDASDIVFAEDKGAETNSRVMQHFDNRTVLYYDRHKLGFSTSKGEIK